MSSRTLSQPLKRPKGVTTRTSGLCNQTCEASATSAAFIDSRYLLKTCSTSARSWFVLLVMRASIQGADVLLPRWTAENGQFVDRAKPANFRRLTETGEFYFVASSVRKAVWI